MPAPATAGVRASPLGVHVARFEYISRNKLELKDGFRHATLGDVSGQVVYGVQGKLKEHYGVPEDAPPMTATLDHIVAAVGG